MEQNKYSIRLAADLQTDSVVDGPGLRAVIWTQGCGHNCYGCQNPQTHDFKGGADIPIELVCDAIDELEYHSGITFSGGDPMYQPEACNEIAKYAIKKGFNIWVYTGFTYEELIKMSESNPIYMDFLNNIDILVDGPFKLEERDLSLLFRGSRNQRLIDVKKSLKNGEITVLNEYEYNENKFFEKQPMFI